VNDMDLSKIDVNKHLRRLLVGFLVMLSFFWFPLAWVALTIALMCSIGAYVVGALMIDGFDLLRRK